MSISESLKQKIPESLKPPLRLAFMSIQKDIWKSNTFISSKTI